MGFLSIVQNNLYLKTKYIYKKHLKQQLLSTLWSDIFWFNQNNNATIYKFCLSEETKGSVFYSLVNFTLSTKIFTLCSKNSSGFLNSLLFCSSILFEPDSFYCQPGELPGKETGGVALVKGKKVWVMIRHLLEGTQNKGEGSRRDERDRFWMRPKFCMQKIPWLKLEIHSIPNLTFSLPPMLVQDSIYIIFQVFLVLSDSSLS